MLTISIDEASRNLADTIARVAADRQPLGIGDDGGVEVALVSVATLGRQREASDGDREQNLFDRASRMARLGYWEWDEISDCCVACSDELGRLFGVTAAEYVRCTNSTQAYLSWVHAEDRAHVERVIAEARSHNSGYDVEYRLVRNDGSVLDVREVAAPELDEAGRMIGSTGIVQDISDRKRLERELRRSRDMLEQRVRERTEELAVANKALEAEIVERRGTEAALRSSKERFRDIAASIPGVVYQFKIDAEGIPSFPYVSPTFRAMFGIDAADVIEDPDVWFDLIHPDDRPDLFASIRKSHESLEAWSWEGRVVSPDGKTGCFRGSSVPRRLADGSVLWNGLVLDITESKRALQALHNSEEQFRRVIDNLQILIGLVDGDERMLWCNRLASQWLQKPMEEIIGRRLSEINLPAHYEAVLPEIREAMAGRRAETESEAVYPDGITRHVHRTYVPNIGRDGSVSGFYFFVHDITGRKNAEQATREYSKQLKLITDNLPVLIAYVGADEHYRFVNRCCCEWYARPEEEIIGHAISEIHRDNYALFNERIARVRMGSPVEFEDRVTYPDGVTRDIRARFVPHKADDGAVIGIFSVVEDVTAIKQVEERARQSQKMEAVGQLTGGVAHDFNNLLAVIIGNAEILLEDLGEDDPSPKAILRAARRGTELTQRLLAFSRRQPLDPQSVDLGNLVTGMTGMLGRTLGEAIEIAVSRQEGLWPAMADAGQVENALLNLAINSRDAMPTGGRLTIECMNARLDPDSLVDNSDASPGEYAVLAVSDSGAGMPPSVLEHAFEPFFTTKEVGQGTGLGLSMIYGFAKQSGGHVTIYSEEGKGTTVKLYLPRAVAPVVPCTPEDLSKLPHGQGETVLLLEDDDDVRALAARILKGLDYEVIQAAHAEEAGELLARVGGVDLLLSDVVLPGVSNGPEFARDVRVAYPDMKVLFMSGYPAEATRRNDLADLEGAMLLSKPLDRRELALAIFGLLRA